MLLEGIKVCIGKLIIQLLVFVLFFKIQRQSLCKRHFNIKVLSPPRSQAMLFFMFEDLVPSIPYLISTLLASWRICDENLTFPATCSVSRAVITRWDLAQRNQMTQVFLVQAVLTVAWRTRLPTGCVLGSRSR